MPSLILSGWTQPVDALAPWVPGAITFDYSDYPNAISAIAALARWHEVTQVVAWSLGAQLALRAVAAGALAPKHLLLVAPPYRFVNAEGFAHGMGADTFALFRQNYATDPARTMGRFHGLVAKGHSDPRHILRQLQHHPQTASTERWLPWLDTLGAQSLDGLCVPHTGDVTLLHGANDAIVPVAQADYIRALVPHARYEQWEGTGHAPHLQDSQRFAGLLARKGTIA